MPNKVTFSHSKISVYMYMPIRKQTNITSIEGGLYFVVVLMGLIETKLG